MATKQQIGVVVSASGAKEYERQLKLLTQYTKEWKSETDKLTSSFDKNEKSMANVAKERDALEKEIDSLNKVLKLQQDRWGELATTMNGMPTDKQQLEFSKLRTSINETQIKINDLKNRIKELPTDSFFSRKQYIENTEKLAHQTGVLASKTAALDSAMELNGRTMGGVQSIFLNLHNFETKPQPIIFVIKPIRTKQIENKRISPVTLSILVFKPILAKKTGPNNI